MAYQALYRKWRPMNFDDVIGQAHITDTIKNEILSSRLAHAYLFTGTRGTGKTSTAKILSRAVNCASPQNGNPCNECEICKSILAETCLDVQEIDAASNTGVDNIRDIISQVQYVPSAGKYKVFIIDEVHMLSKGAFNALLKTLEEPPAHVIFILATTEIQQIPATILSRCQRFDFKTIAISDIVANLSAILSSEGISATEDALEYVAYLGDGSMRDSLSILDQCLAFCKDELTLDKVTDVVGAVDDKILYDFASDIAKNDTVSALRRFNECVESGKNFDNIAKGLLSVLREIIMYKINAESFSASKIKKQYLASCADSFDVPSLVNHINILTECIASFKTFASQRVLCECTLIRLTTPEMNEDYQSSLARISALENKLASLLAGGIQLNTESQSDASYEEIPLPEPPGEFDDVYVPDIEQPVDAKASEPAPKPQEKDGSVQSVIDNWSDVTAYLVSNGKLTLYTMLFGCKLSDDEGVLLVSVDDADKRHTLSEPANKEIIINAIESSLGVGVDVKFSSDTPQSVDDTDDVFKSLDAVGKNFPINFKLD